MNRGFYLILIIFFSPLFHLLSQSTTLDFVVPNIVCFEENFPIQNISNGYNNYQFDLCEGDLSLSPTLTINEESNFKVPIGASLIKGEEKWYGFVCSMNDNALFRIDFGDSLTNKSPITVKLNNAGGLLNAPQDIKMIKYEGEYFAFIYNRYGNQLIRVNFGSSIENLNVSADVLVTGNGFINGGIDVVFDGKNWTAAITYSNYIKIINLGDSPKNIPEPKDIINTNTIEDIDGIGDIDFVNDNGQWYGFAVGFDSKTVHRLDFGNSLFINPVPQKLAFSELGILQPRSLVIKKDKGEWIIFSATGQGDFLRFNLGSSITNNTPAFTNLGKLGGLNNTFKIAIANSSSRWVALTTAWSTNSYYLIEFPQAENPFDQEYSNNSEYIKALKTGLQYITLYAKDSKGIPERVTKTTKVLNQQAPVLNFTPNNLCFYDPINFTVSSDQTLTSYLWDFGDTQTATGQEVSHQYTTSGTYDVRLSVESENGCGNFIEKEITIYPEPVPDFIFPEEMICTNGEIIFENTTPGEYNDDITWLWDFGDGTTSTEKNPSHTYATSGTKTVQLTASIPGCSASQSYEIQVISGPAVNFSAAHLCFGQEVQFTDLTTGSDIISYAWDFGNGLTSGEQNPVAMYEAPGTYEIQLAVKNAAGCLNTFSKSVTINELPEPDFVHGQVCEGMPEEFLNRTPNINIESWYWDFGFTTSSERDPIITFDEPGEHTVSLVVTSTFDCTDTTSKTVQVKTAPQAEYTVQEGCPGAITRFVDKSSATDDNGITSWLWEINGNLYEEQNPEVLFEVPGIYGVSLTVTSGSSCQNTITREIVIDPLPEVDFNYTSACIGQPVAFEDMTQITGPDEIISWHWTFGEITTAALQNPSIIFSAPGDVPVSLTVTSAKGCTSSITKIVRVNDMPEAAFSAGNTIGAPPLAIDFQNNSTGAISYQWLFGDPMKNSSTLAAPSFKFNQIGDYKVRLIAMNEAGCTDTASVMINVLVPVLDVALEQIYSLNPEGDIQLVLKISNKGSVPLKAMNIFLDIDGEVELKELFSETVGAGESVNHALNMKILRERVDEISYVCVSLKVNDEQFVEGNLTDNKFCYDLNGQFILLQAFPNPTSATLNLNFIMPEQKPVTVHLYNIYGESIMKTALSDVHTGFNQYTKDVSTFPKGVYFFKILHEGKAYVQKFLVE